MLPHKVPAARPHAQTRLAITLGCKLPEGLLTPGAARRVITPGNCRLVRPGVIKPQDLIEGSVPGHGGEGGHGPVTQAGAGLGRAGPLAATCLGTCLGVPQAVRSPRLAWLLAPIRSPPSSAA